MEQLYLAVFTVVAGVLGCVGYFFISNFILDSIFKPYGPNAGSNIRRATAIRPWLFLFPAIFVLTIYLVYPAFISIWFSLTNNTGDEFVGLDNYRWLFVDEKFRESMFNNMLWLIVVPAASTFLGLIIAALTDRAKMGNVAKSMVFMPMAISFVGASVIWKLVYDYRAEGSEQIGILNAVTTQLGFEPAAWITIPFWNNFFLMVILIWIQTGFAMVILSAALRGISEEIVEASIIDGATPLQVFWKIKVPQIWSTIAVVWTTITILVLKVFDIVLAMTNGQWGSQVLANLMFDWMFRGGDIGRASTIAIVIMILVVPIMVWNIYIARKDFE